MAEGEGEGEIVVSIYNDETKQEEPLRPSAKWQQGDPPVVYINSGNITDGSFVNSQGMRIETYTWLTDAAQPARGDIIVVHGLGMHCRYTYLSHVDYDEETGEPHYHNPDIENSFVKAMNEQGFNVHGFDMQSYGMSEGLQEMRGYFLSYDDHVADLTQFSESIKREYSPQKFL